MTPCVLRVMISRYVLATLALAGCAGEAPMQPKPSVPAPAGTQSDAPPDASTLDHPGSQDAGTVLDAVATTTTSEAAEAPATMTEEERWCHEQGRKHHEVVRDHPDSFPTDPRAECRGGFAWRARALLPPKADETWLRGHYEVVIVHREADGSDRIAHSMRIKSAQTWGSEVWSGFTTGDVDGDGQPEVFWTVWLHEEGVQPFTSYLMTLDKATRQLRKVPLPFGARPSGLTDADGDGLFDVPTTGPYARLEYPTVIGGNTPWFSEGMFLLHSLGRFRFDVRDAVAEAWVREFCGRKREPSTPGPEPRAGLPDYRSPERVICDRIEGKRASAVIAAIRAQCPKLQGPAAEPDACMRGLLELAAPEPWTRVRP